MADKTPAKLPFAKGLILRSPEGEHQVVFTTAVRAADGSVIKTRSSSYTIKTMPSAGAVTKETKLPDVALSALHGSTLRLTEPAGSGWSVAGVFE